MDVSRRDLFKGGAVVMAGLAATAGVTALGCKQEEQEKESVPEVKAFEPEGGWALEADVVVCGGGATGAPAAIQAFDDGADVLILEKHDYLGGALRRCAGAYLAPNTSVMRHLGITDDNPAWLEEYLVKLAGEYGDEKLIHTYIEETTKNFEWMIAPVSEGGLGGQPLDTWQISPTPRNFDNPGMIYCMGEVGKGVFYNEFGLEDTERMRVHVFAPNPDDTVSQSKGTGMWKPFGDAIESRGIRVEYQTPFVDVITDDKGMVVGVVAEKDGKQINVKAKKAVILATATFARNPELLRNFAGIEFKELPGAGGAKSFKEDEALGESTMAALRLGAAPRGLLYVERGGVKINEHAQVIDWRGNVIPRLYTGGTIAGGFSSVRCPICGYQTSRGIAFGRIAGAHAAKLDNWDA